VIAGKSGIYSITKGSVRNDSHITTEL